MGKFFYKTLHTLDTFSIPYNDLYKEWGCAKRDGVITLQRFLIVNKRAFDFLSIKADIAIIGNDPYLTLQTSKYAGSVPVMSPLDGKPFGDLCVGGRFGEDVSELLSMIGDTLLPEYNDSLPPLYTSLLEPPLYFECCNFIDKWLGLEKAHWQKFDVIEKIESRPSSGTMWQKYAMRSYDPSRALSYPNRLNRMSTMHKEFQQLLHVLFFCFSELRKPIVPIRSKVAYASKINHLCSKYRESACLAPPTEFMIHASDPVAVKEAKAIANIILNNQRTKKRAWRLDYSEFFERYVQFVFSSVASSVSSKAICNPHYSVSGKIPKWGLHYLEPDLVLQKEGMQCVVDAKYKSHFYNINDVGEELKDTFRADLHQILAYCSFNDMKTKKAILVYPFTDYTYRKLSLHSPLSRTDADVYLLGIPLIKEKFEDLKTNLITLISSYDKEAS